MRAPARPGSLDCARAPRELYVYWRLARADVDAALAALRGWHRQLESDAAGLHARLYLRADVPADEATLMETYRVDADGGEAGVSPGLQARLAAEGDALSAPWRRGSRHFEVFVPCPG
jgi:hypothetical protein